MPFDIDEL